MPSLKDIAKIAAPVVLGAALPGIGAALGGAITGGAAGTAAASGAAAGTAAGGAAGASLGAGAALGTGATGAAGASANTAGWAAAEQAGVQSVAKSAVREKVGAILTNVGKKGLVQAGMSAMGGSPKAPRGGGGGGGTAGGGVSEQTDIPQMGAGNRPPSVFDSASFMQPSQGTPPITQQPMGGGMMPQSMPTANTTGRPPISSGGATMSPQMLALMGGR